MKSPNQKIIQILEEIKENNCDLIFLLLFNGIQIKQFLIFMDENRILNTHAKFVLLYDRRILTSHLHYIWRKILKAIFLRKFIENNEFGNKEIRFELITVPFPNILEKGTFVNKKLTNWKNGKFTDKNFEIFLDKTHNLEGITIKTVVYEHTPMVMKNNMDNKFYGLEVNIMDSLSKVMNFTAEFYQTEDSATEKWGKQLSNGKYTGLLGEMIDHHAILALGDLHFSHYHIKFMDLSIPHSSECLTFLTPESTADNSWKTLIMPFSGTMWACVFIALFCVIIIFYTLSQIHMKIIFRYKIQAQDSSAIRRFQHCMRLKRRKFLINSQTLCKIEAPKDIFDRFSNCILISYSMLLLQVALSRMPRNWPLRIFTGWYWLYCILVVVTYRASFTAILANPSPRITIDTIDELADSNIIVGAWGEQNKEFFDLAFDKAAQKIGSKLELIDDLSQTVERITSGKFAYYDNEYFLRNLRLQNESYKQKEVLLHIMNECVVNMPISLGLEKNSPLKLNIDKYLRRLIEGGFTEKWLRDSIVNLPGEETPPQEALIDMKKIWSSFLVLGFGYIFSILALIGEKLHFKYVVQKDPNYDHLNPIAYYQKKF